MTAMFILKTWLFAHALVFASFLLFATLRRTAKATGIVPTHRQWIRIGQLLLLLSLLLPSLLHSLPTRTLPRVTWINPRPLSETGSAFSKYGDRDWPKAPRGEASSPRASNQPFSRVLSLLSSPDGTVFVHATLLLLILGLLGSAFRLARGALQLRSVLRTATMIRSFGKVRIAVSDSVTIPFSARFGRLSWVVLSGSVFSSGDDYRLALRHELEHHRQGDTTWAVVIEGLVCLFFPNPAIHLWKRELVELQEFSCDEALIGRRGVSSHDYGSCLVRVAEAALGNRQMHVGTTCMAAVSRNPFYLKSFLRRRIEMFADHEIKGNRRWAGSVLGTLAALFTVALAFGAEQSLRTDSPLSVNPGEVVVDPEVQGIADAVLSKAIADEHAKSGFAIVADPRSGRILAVANIDTTGRQTGYWSLGEVFEPASVMKTLVAAQAIELGLTTPTERLACENGRYRYGDRYYYDWKTNGWDFLSTQATIGLSSNICAIKLGDRVGGPGLLAMMRNFGFGPAGSASGFPKARSGNLPPPDEDGEHLRVVPYLTMGAGFSISPIEMLQAYGAIANGGNLMRAIQAASSDSEAHVVRRVLSPETAGQMRSILRQTVLEGTGRPATSGVYTTAGKTGTGHYPRSMPFDRNDGNFASFIGFAPAENPRVEIYVGVRDPESADGAHGGSHAGPVFRKIAEEVLKHLKVAPDLP